MKQLLAWIVIAMVPVSVAPMWGHAQGQQGNAAAANASAPAAAGDLTGNWQGTLALGNGQRVLIKVTKEGAQGAPYKGTLYLIDGGGRMAALPAIAVHGSDVSFSIPSLGAGFDGSLNAEGKTISGNVKMGDGSSHALNLDHVTNDVAWAIPEPPKAMPANAKPKFDVLTIKPSDPNRPGKLFTIKGRHVLTINTAVSDLITFAYGLHPKQVVNGPAWLDEKYDLDGVPDVAGQPSTPQMRMLIQDALATRFGLRFHHEQRELAAYAVTVAKGGPKLTVTSDPPSAPVNFTFARLGQLRVTNATMKDFCDGMQGAVMDKPVVDQTGLTQRYDFTLSWTPDESQFAVLGGYKAPAQEDPNAPPSLYTALQEQLGLKMENTKANVETFVIDSIQKPSAN
ncbi:MAG TPA: TIGR03435 family protein [Acidobacteriaceae bacterium]|nr:TIGR03435 family protein [Acidobacteriaceae bacterium]